METIHLRIVDFVIKLNFWPTEKEYFREEIMKSIRILYANFIVKQKKSRTDFTIDFYMRDTSQVIRYKDKENESLFVQIYTVISKKRIRTIYSISFWQFQFILRKALEILLIKNNGFVLHASGVAKNSRAFLFVGKPGAGKTTISRLLGNKLSIIADDSIIIIKKRKNFVLYQTPYIENNQSIIRTGKPYIIGGIYFIKKSTDARIEPLTDKQRIFQRFIQQFLTIELTNKVQIKLCFEFMKRYTFNVLSFSDDPAKLNHLYETIYGK